MSAVEVHMLHVTDGLAASDTTISLEGDFDRVAAYRVRREVLRAPTDRMVHLLFGHVRFVEDAALAVLADTIRAAGPSHVALEGLSHHQETILHYLGVEHTTDCTKCRR